MWLPLLAHVLLASQTDQPFDFACKACSVSKLLTQLDKVAGTHSKAGPSVAHEIVYVRVSHMTAPDLRANLAEVVGGHWEHAGSEDVLTRGAADERAIWSAHIAYRRKLVDKALAAAKARLATPFDANGLAVGLAQEPTGLPNDQREARRRYLAEKNLFGRGPMARLLDRLILACDPNDLAAIGPYQRHVFRLDATPMQHRISPDKYQAALAAFATEQAAWKEAATHATFRRDEGGSAASDPRSQVDIATDPGPVSLEISRGEMAGLFMVNLTASVSPFGYRIVTQTVFADPAREFLDASMTPKPPAKDDPDVSLSPESAMFAERAVGLFKQGSPEPVSDALLKQMLGVESSDPLSWSVSDTLDGYSAAQHVNIVAALPDAAFTYSLFGAANGKPHVGQAMGDLTASGTIALTALPNCVQIGPVDRYEAELDFTPRKPVAALMSATVSDGRLDTMRYAQFAFESKRLNRGGLDMIFLAMYDRSLLGPSDRTSWKSLQLFGALDREQLRTLGSGGSITYGVLSPDQRRIVERIVYAGRLSRLNADGGSNVWAIEPTENFATGIPSGARITATTRSTPVIVAYCKGKDGKTRPSRSLDARNLADVVVNVVGNPERMAQYGVSDLAGFAMGTETTWTIRVQLDAQAFADSTILVPTYDAAATPVAWDKLPDAVAKQVASQVKQFTDQKSKQTASKSPP